MVETKSLYAQEVHEVSGALASTTPASTAKVGQFSSKCLYTTKYRQVLHFIEHKCIKMALFEPLKSPILVSRKI